MIKGIQRQMVMLRTSESDLFEMAYFVLRSDVGDSDSRSLVDEANHIVLSVCADRRGLKKEKGKRNTARWAFFLLGVMLGALAVAIVFGLARL